MVRTRRPVALALVALVAVLVVIGGIAFVMSGSNEPEPVDLPTTLGWVAFAVGDSAGGNDIYLARQGQAARRIIGSDSDGLEQVCPTFSPDGAQLAYGQARGTADVGYSGGLLVIASIDQDGNASPTFELDVGATSAPPCPLWSPDGQRIAIAVHGGERVSPPQGSDVEGEVWVVGLDGEDTTVLPGLYEFSGDHWGSPDMEWSPDGAELAFANGQITIYSILTGEFRTLDRSQGAQFLTWSPDGTRIAYQRRGELRIAEVDGTEDYLLADDFESFHGIGPVWSPTGDRIVYQRTCSTYLSSFSPNQPCREQHEVVLVTPDGSETVLPHLRLPGTDETELWWPYGVTWSPDGQQLLYFAWADPADAPSQVERTGLIAVPIDSDSPPVMLHEGVSKYVDDDSLGSQSWSR